MSRITKEEIEKTKCGRFLLSDENIYLSIYSLNSYVFEYNLLNTEDRILYHRLQDKFDARLINGVITRVREQIIELFDKDKYIEAKVYFKPKKLSENGELEFRPLHSTGLITQIAIVSMLHLFVYEIPEEEEGDPKLRLSNLSRLIPSDFYGNRVSVKPEYLFKPWKQQYQKYNQNSNDALMKYHTSLEYKYEVTLDLENFFPTINPIIIYRYIINHLPAYLNDEERKMMKRVLQKLLFCKLTTTFDEKTAGQYYKVTKGAGNYDNVDKIEQNEKECWAFKEKSDKFVRGIPQGLPQSYFLGNIYMISIAEIFRKKFTGVSYFYVDDSVIFTNDVREDNFKEQLKELNKQIADEANNFEEDSAIYPEGTEKFYKSDLYGVNVHLDGKSNYTRLDNLDDSEVYLKCISREMSQAGSDFFRMYSDEENRNLEEKLDVLSKQVKAKRDQLVEEKSQKRDSGNEDAIEKDEDDTQKFEKRLTRYYRFFEYRKQRLVAMHQPENGSDEDYKKELEKIIYSELSEEDMEDDEKILQAFMNSYGADIWDAAIGMYQTFADDKEQNVLKNYILKINELCYGKASVEFSYLECTYRDLLRNEEENDYSVEEDIFEETLKRYMTEEDLRDIYNDPYKTLKYLARVRLKRYANKHYEVAEDYSSKLLKKTDEEILKILLSEKVTENEIKENQNLYEDELDILSVKKYMLESYKKLDEYFEKKIRRRHAIDSSSEIRQRAEIKYLDMPMRELVAEVSEAHGADERNIYSIKSNASSRLMSIKFDKILLRLADLLDMSSYRVSKPILYHNMEQMSEESAFHWISHLLTQGYKLRTKYEIGSSKSSGTDNLKETEESLENIEGVLTPQTITEKLILEIPVDISQMSTIECENPCRKVQIGNISRQEITLICGEGCQNKSNDGLENRCNFLCRWFCVKNDYLIKELVALKEYLNRNKNNYFKCEIEIKIKCNNKTSIEARQFEILNHYIQDRK